MKILAHRLIDASVRFLASTAIVVSITAVIFFVGMSIFWFLDSPAARGWRALGSPPEKPAKIVMAEFEDIWIQSVTGKMYSCATYTQGRCWTERSEPPGAPRNFCRPSYAESIREPNGKIIDKAVTCWSDRGESKYVLSEDGHVWVWEYRYQSPYTSIGNQITNTICILIIGIVFGVFVAVIISRTKSP